MPSSRKTKPKNTSTITMARKGRPPESGTRWFIVPTVTRPRAGPESSGDLEAEAARGPGLLPAGPQPAQPLHQHRVGGQRLGTFHQRVEHLVVAGGRHREKLADRFFLRACELPPLPLEREDVMLATGQPVSGFGLVPRSACPRHGAVHIVLPGAVCSSPKGLIAGPNDIHGVSANI